MAIEQIINNSFALILQDVQERLQDGWEIDFSSERYPQDHFTYYEVHMVKESEQKSPKVKPGRPAQKK